MANYTIPPFSWDDTHSAYTVRHRLSTGQFCQIWFIRHTMQNYVCYSVAFAVANKKKHLAGWFSCDSRDRLSCRMTGRSGVEALYWARDMLLSFEDVVVPEILLWLHGGNMLKICIGAEDGKRWRLYEKALQRYGYSVVRDQQLRFLEKKFQKF